MADRLKELPAKVLGWWNKFTSKQKNIIVGIVAAVILTFAIIVYTVSKPQYTRLMTCDNTAQAAEVIKILEDAGINYDASADGLKIDVESEQVGTANVALGAAGYVPDGMDIDDVLSSSLSTTESDKQKRWTVYLASQLETFFEEMPMIKTAKVRLHIPDQNGTLAAQRQESSAYVQLELVDTFTSANAANMAKAIATFLGNKTTANITIIDYESNLLFAGGDDYSIGGAANSMQELQSQAETVMANQVTRVLVGTNQFSTVDVAPHLNVDYASYQETIKEYSAPEGRDEGMLAHQATFEAENTNDGAGAPGTDSNNGNTIVWQDGSNSSSSQSEVESDYLPNERIQYKDLAAGSIDPANSSVAISAIRFREVRQEDVEAQGLLDGMTWEAYKLANGDDVKLEVDPDYYRLVENATGISQDRITIIAYETRVFYDKEGMKLDSATVMSGVMFFLILALLAFVVLRSMISRREVAQEEELSVENLLQSTPEPELEDIDLEAKSEARRIIEKFVDENPEAAAALLRNWLDDDWG